MIFNPRALCSIIFICLYQLAFSQDSLRIVNSYVNEVSRKAAGIESKLDKRPEKALHILEKIESRMKRKLSRIDSVKVKEIFSNGPKITKGELPKYIPSLDTMTSALKFLNQNPALDKVNQLQSQFANAEQVQKLLKERRDYLKSQLANLGFAKELKRLNKELYYYSAQVNAYKSLLKDKKKREKKALELLSKNKHFKEFMRKNSQLESMFRLPGSEPATQASLAGLQTRAQVNTLIQQQVGPGGMQQFRQNIQDAQAQIQQLKNKILSSGASSSDDIMPEGFRPKNQKTKSFWQRLEYGTNVQTTKSNGWFPVTSDVGLSVGYKLDKSIFGIGASYKLGWGKDIRSINITHQGVGVRSFVDIKLKGSFWISGGYEMNYRASFNSIDVLKELNAWQQSGLIGMSKTVSIKSKVFKKTKLMLLWDFLSYQQVPMTQSLVFRVGYNF